MNAAVHWSTIGAMILCGLSMGALFDIYRVASRKFKISRWLLPALDLLYWIVATAAVFQVLLRSNHGEVRLYVFLGLGIGITAYFGILSSTVLLVTAWLLQALTRLAYVIARTFRVLILTPILWIVKALARILDILFIVTAAILLWIFKLLLKPLTPLGRWGWDRLLPVRNLLNGWRLKFQTLKERVKQIWQLLRGKQ